MERLVTNKSDVYTNEGEYLDRISFLSATDNLHDSFHVEDDEGVPLFFVVVSK